MRAILLIFATVISAASLQPLNVKFKVRGYFLAASTRSEIAGLDREFAKTIAVPRRVDRDFPAGRLTLLALPREATAFGRYKGLRVILANTTRTKGDFEAQDGRINIYREALDADGRWKPIEYLPNSWCGNSYHRTYLQPDHYWSFAAPQYEGTVRTRMRFVLEQQGLKLVSNEFEGTVNREQFVKLQGHEPTNLMDPYND